MCTVQPDLAAYLLNYQDNDVINSDVNSSIVCEESSSNDINEENSTNDSERLPKRQENRTSSRKSNENAKLTVPTTNKKRQDIRVNTQPKNKKVCQTMTGPNKIFSDKSIIELLKYQDSDQMDTTYSAPRNKGMDSSRYSEIERHGFDSGLHLNEKWNRTCLIPVSSNEMSDSDSDDDSDSESFTEDQLALIETVMSHDIAACEDTDHVCENEKQNNSFPPQNQDVFDNAKQTSQSESNDLSSSQELIPHEPCSTIEDQEVYVDCRDSQELEHAASKLERNSEKINVDITETSSNSEGSILSAELDGSVETQDQFTHLESAESTILPDVTHPSNKMMQNDNNHSSEKVETVQGVKKDVMVLDSDCETRSIQSLDFDLFARNDVIASTPIHSVSANTSIDNNSLEVTARFKVHECTPNEMSKNAINYLMRMDEDDVDDAIESMLTSQFPRFDAFSALIHPTRLPLCSSHYDSEQQSSSSELVDDMMIETEVCAEVTVDNDIPNPLEEDAPFLPPERRDTADVAQEELPSNYLQKPSTDTPQVAHKNSKNKCKPKIDKIKESKSVKPKTDRSVIQKKLKQKKCTVMTELKKQQLLSKYINNGKQMQLVIPFLPIRSKKKTNFKVMPRNTSLINKVINKPTSVVQKKPYSGKNTAEITTKDTRIPSHSTTSNSQTSEAVEKKELEVPTDDNDDTIRSISTNVANDSRSSDREPNVNNVKVDNYQTNQNTECLNNNETPHESEMCEERLSTTNNVDVLSAVCELDIETDVSNTITQQAHQISSGQASTGSIDLGFNVKLSDTIEDEEALKLQSDSNCEENVDLSSCVVQAKEQTEDEDCTPIADSCQHAFVGSCKDSFIQEEELQEGSLELSLGKNTNNAMDNDTSIESCKDTLLKKKEHLEESTELFLEKVTDSATMDTDTSAESYNDIALQEVIKDGNDQRQHALVGNCHDEIGLQEESIELSLERTTNVTTITSGNPFESYKDIPLEETSKDDNETAESTMDLKNDGSIPVNHCEDTIGEEKVLEEKCVQNPTKDRNISVHNIESSNKDMEVNDDHYERILPPENKHQEEKTMQSPSNNPEHGTKDLKNDVSELVTVDQCDSTLIQEKESLTNDDQFGEDAVSSVDSSQNTQLHVKEKLEEESRKSNNPESVNSCGLMFSCKDMSHKSESLEISSKEETSLQTITTHNLNSTYLDFSCHEENTNVTIRKRKAEKLNESFVTAANKSEDIAEAKKPKRRMKEKAIKYYKEKIKQLKRENEHYKDKSMMLDWVSDFRNEIKHLKKSIATLQNKNEEHAAIINRQEADLQRLGQEMSLLNPSTRNSRKQDRQDATITSSDSNECQP